ncbi:AGE family epimerase/isomerase [Candidatus Omnitrophota bacterium]
MKRRSFFGTSAGTAALVSGITGCTQEKKTGQPAQEKTILDKNGKIGGKTLQELRERYRYDLLDDYIPFLYKYVVDHELGGFMCTTDRDGTNLDTNKRAWYEGRGTWVSSFLYNNIDPAPEHLEVVRKSVDFTLKLKPEGDKLWPGGFTREGKPTYEDLRVYGDLFIATGLQEYSRAVKDDSYWDMAKDIMLKCMRIYDSPDYGKPTDGSTPRTPPGTRFLGHWMIFIRLASQMLADREDNEVKGIIDRCIDSILNKHLHPEYNMLVEELPHDMEFKPGEKYNVIALGHGTETLWMLMFEAYRRKDMGLYEKAATLFKRQVEAAWDDVFGGAFTNMTIEEEESKMSYRTNKVLWLQEEVLIGTLFMIEHFGDEWAKRWYNKMYTYVLDKYPLKQYGFPIWILSADQRVTFREHTRRVGNFHHPRHLMINLLAIDRMIERGGAVSNYFG